MRVKYLQEGGPMGPEMAGGAPMPEEMPMEAGAPMPEEAGAPAPGGEDEMMAQIGQMADQVIQELGPDVAGMLAQAIMERLQGGGGMAPEAAPMPAPEEQPAFQRMGGVMRRIY